MKIGHFEAETEVTFLPRCANCEAPHPKVRRPLPANLEVCPDCNHPSYQGKTKVVKASITGKGLGFAALLLSTGKYFRNLANRD